jgi:hypothetical protein
MMSKDQLLLKAALQQLMALTPCDRLHESTLALIEKIRLALAEAGHE